MEELFESIEGGKIEKSIDLINNINIDFTIKNSNEHTIFIASVLKGNKAIIELLIKKGANIKATYDKRRTPLHYSAQNGKTEITSLLIEKGANIEAQDDYGKTPLHYSTQNRKPETTILLIEKGANIEAKDKCGETPLHISAQNGKTKTTLLLIEKGANIEAKDIYNQTPYDLSENEEIRSIIKSAIIKENQKNYKTLCTLLTDPKKLQNPLEILGIEAIYEEIQPEHFPLTFSQQYEIYGEVMKSLYQ